MALQEVPSPLYNNANFQCSYCKNTWQVTYNDIGLLLADKPIACKTCHKMVTLSNEESLLLKKRFKQAKKLSQIALGFIFPYFIMCGALVFLTSGAIAIIAIVLGFAFLMILRSSLTKNGIDHFTLVAPTQTDYTTLHR